VALALSYPLGAAFVAGTGVVGTPTAERFAQAGVNVALTYHGSRERAESLAARLAGDYGVEALALRVDLRDDTSVAAGLDRAAERLGPLRTVVYAAGPTLEFAAIRDLPASKVEDFLLRDTLCCYRLFHFAIPRVAVSGGGSLTACVTMANRRVIDNDALSSMPKAAVEALVRQVAAEEAPNGIRANAIGVGWMGGWANTFDEARAAVASMPAEMAAQVSPMIEQMISLIRMRRPGSGGEAADLIAYLASEQASYVTGRTVCVDGGASL
jgi:NAD(P)-dependent dehydrogenase (short-subunit alcohol dehydrogenase family)